MKLKFDLEKFLKEIGDINYHVVCIAIVFFDDSNRMWKDFLFLKKYKERREIYTI